MGVSIAHKRVGYAEINRIHAEAVAAREKLERDVTLQGTQAYLQAKVAAAKGTEQIYQELNLRRFQIEQEELQKGMRLDDQRIAAQMEASNRLKELERQNAEEVTRAEEQAAVDILPPWQRSYAQISLDTQRRLREIQQAQKDTRLSAEEAAKLSAAARQIEFAKVRDQLAGDLENLFDNITSGNIGKYFLTQFKHMVFQMVAAWILGMQQMKAASQQQMGSGGGILGSIFGGIFGGGGFGGGVGPGGTPPIFGGGVGGVLAPTVGGGLLGPGGNGDFGGEVSGRGSSSGGGGLLGGLFGSIGLSAGGGAGAGTTLPSGAGPGGAAGGPIGLLLGKLGPVGQMLGGLLSVAGIGGMALLGSSFGKGGILNGLIGAAGGGLSTFAALSPLLAAGPLGWIAVGIGSLLGFLGGFFQHSTKKARLEIEANIKRQAATIEDAYNLYQIDWTSSRGQLEQLRQQGVDALKQAGVKDIDRSRVGHVDQWIDKAEKEIDLTQQERLRRGALVFGPPEFRVGGFVGAAAGGAIPSWFAGTAMHFAGGGAVPAILHEGEYVMRPEAVSRIGRLNLDWMNSGGGGGDVHIHINAIDKDSFREWLGRGGATEIVRSLRQGTSEGKW
jgi:hypothetical protein